MKANANWCRTNGHCHRRGQKNVFFLLGWNFVYRTDNHRLIGTMWIFLSSHIAMDWSKIKTFFWWWPKMRQILRSFGMWKKDSQLPMSVPSSLLEASCLRDLEHNCSEEMIIMIMIMMTRKKMRSRLSFPNHEQKTTAFPLAGRHLLEVENCKIASFFYGFPLPSKLCLLSLTQLVSNRLDGMYILMRCSEKIFHLSSSLFPLSLS